MTRDPAPLRRAGRQPPATAFASAFASAGRSLLATLTAVVLTALAPGAALAQETSCDPGDVEVRRLEFAGNATFTDAELARGIVTTPSSFFRRTTGLFGARRCVDRDELRLDVARLALYYRKRGFVDARVDTVLTPARPPAVDVRFVIEEGIPLTLDTLNVNGMEAVAARESLVRGLGLRVGDRFDQYALDSARTLLARRLRDSGYPFADVLLSFSTWVQTRSASVTLDVNPGPLARIGIVHLDVAPREGNEQQIPEPVVRGLMGLKPGATYRERDLIQAQRRLYQTDGYRHVQIALDTSAAGGVADSTVDLRVTLRETYMRSARVALGYGTLDCFRVGGEYSDVNFLHTARRLDLTARMSKIGIGDPLDVAPGLCFPEVRNDIYSDTLNYYAGATLRTPVFFGTTFPTMTLYTERRSEFKAYLRTTPIALGLSRQWPRGLGLGFPVTTSYNLEYGRTEAQPALLCAAFNLCTEVDRGRVQEYRRLAVVGASVVHDRTDDPVEPRHGSILRLEARHASRIVGSDPLQQFNQVTGNASIYEAITPALVLAARVRVGAVLGSTFAREGDPRFVPPQERLYAGGPATVRGFRQNELGPVVYIANSYTEETIAGPDGQPRTVFRTTPADGYARVVPVGGNAVVVANLEARLRSPVWPEVLQLTGFLDGGKVSPRLDFRLDDLRWTPGAGIRVESPVGPLRVDVGYNPYKLAAGAAYFDAPIVGSVAPLYCVSPGNTFRISDVDGVPVQQTGGLPCPASFQPTQQRGLFRRLTFNFSIGQAF